jgi:hypothetical protein
MEVAALVVAVVAVTLSALSLGWQTATFFLSGPRVKAHLREGFYGAGGSMIAHHQQPMPAFLFTLETEDGMPAEPAELHSAVPN